MHSRDRRLYERAVRLWGKDAQIRKATEECIELANALTHYHKSQDARDAVIDEMVDVSIMVDQLKVILDIDPVEYAQRESDVMKRILRMIIVEERNLEGLQAGKGG